MLHQGIIYYTEEKKCKTKPHFLEKHEITKIYPPIIQLIPKDNAYVIWKNNGEFWADKLFGFVLVEDLVDGELDTHIRPWFIGVNFCTGLDEKYYDVMESEHKPTEEELKKRYER